MGDARRRSVTTAALPVVLALVAGGLLVAPAAAALDEHDRPTSVGGDAGDRLTAQSDGGSPPGHEHPAGTFQNSFVEAAHVAAEADGPLAANAALPTGFSDQKVIGGFSEAVSADFAPDGTAFVALKTGQVKVAEYGGATGTWGVATDFADLQTQVDNYGDRGLTGIAVDPQFPTRPYVYVNYTYDKDPRDGSGGVVPKWGKGAAYDDCPAPATEANPSITGCVVQDRVTRLTASHSSGAWRMTSEKELLVSGCYQFSSHASGDVAFGPDGKLYASSGEGASFNTQDYGQYSSPCPGDPADEGGSLRSQDYRSASDALGVDGSVFRMDPDSGVVPAQANASSWLVAYGQRNPWRLAFRPKADGSGLSNELWSADVGASKSEEVNRIPDVTAVTTPVNRGWPCYEGDYTQSQVQPAWDALNRPLCETLYSQGLGAVQKPVFSYQTRDGGPLVAGEDCANETSSVSGVAFGTAQSNYPAAYKGAMFFSDFARSCIWVLAKLGDGEPDPTKIQTFVQAAATPVDLLTGPGGDLYYVDYGLTADGGVGEGLAGVHRIVYTGSNAVPTARITSPGAFSGPAPLTVSFSGATSSDPDADTLTYRWDFDNNGTWDAAGVTSSHTYAVGTYTAKLEVDDGHGHTATTSQQVQAGNTAPVLGAVSPAGSLTWAAGDQISYSATASDQQQGTMLSDSFSWRLEIRHCPSGVCHSHPFGTFTGATGTFTAPPHEYPSHLLLTVTVTDSGGLTDSRTIQLDPKTVDLTFASSPTGAQVTVGETPHPAPYTETFIQKSPVTVTAAPTTGSGATIAAFSSWSDAGARSHLVTPGTSNATLTATYTRPTAALVASPTSGTAPLTVSYTASATNAPGATGAFTYAWDLDNDGAFDDGTGATQSATYATSGARTVRVLVTDSRGATDAKSVTVTVAAAPANQSPTARIVADKTSGNAPLTVTFDGTTSSDPDGDVLGYSWDLDGDGTFGDSTAAKPQRTYAAGSYTVGLRVSDGRSGTSSASIVVTANGSPTARIVTTPSPASGTAPLAVSFDGRTSTDPNTGDTLTYSWDLDGNGTFETANSPSPSRTYSVGTTNVTLQVSDGHGGTSTASTTVTATNSAPTITSLSPAAGTTWSVGQALGYSAAAADAQETLADAAFAWNLERQDCATGCARTLVATSTGRSGSVMVPEMPYPSHLFLTLTVTDSAGLTATQTRQLEPRTADLTFATTPTGGVVTVGGADHTAPYVQTFVQGAHVAVSVPAARTVTGAGYAFASWSDTGARSHSVTVPAASTTFTAAYSRQNRLPTAAIAANPSSGTAPLPVSLTGSATDPDGDDTTFAFAWDLDADGQYDDASGATAARSYSGVGPHQVGLQVTDQHSGVATATTTVTVLNSGPTARITTTPENPTGLAPFTVQFDGTGSVDPDGGALVYAWDLDGDGAFDDGTQPTASRVYGVGTTTVKLRVTDLDNATSVASVVVSAPNRNPVAALAAGPASGPAPLLVSLSAAGSSDPDGGALAYAWDLDDDGAFDDATGPTASRTFTGVGGHRVRVQVTDANGGTGTASATVTVTNSGPTASIATSPASGSGPAPLPATLDGTGSADPDGGPLSYAWDLDGDGAYDDATTPTASRTYPVGVTAVGLRVTDQAGGTATATTTITATNTGPTVERVNTYPGGAFYVGQTLGFDVSATDPQQALPDSAYTFVMFGQECAIGCPRVELRRWTGVRTGQFQVPPMPYPSHLYLVATVTDAHGASATKEVLIEPQVSRLEVRATNGLAVDVRAVSRKDGWSGRVVTGSTVRVVAPKQQQRRGTRWVFVRWSDGGERRHDVTVWDPSLTLTAIYRRSR
jgi:PKD repeat protein